MNAHYTKCFLLIMFYCGCKGRNDGTHILNLSDSSLTMIQENLFIKNPDNYSKEFVGELEIKAVHDSSYNKLQLIDSLIIYNNDTIYFPVQIDSGRTYCFVGCSESERYQLKLRRINLTDLNYEYLINGKPHEFHNGKGTVTMELYYLINKTLTYDNIQNLASDFIKYTEPLNDSYFYIYVEKNNRGKLHAVVSEGIFIVRPPFEERTPILEEQ